MDCSPPGSSVHGILQVRILEWVAVPSLRGSSQPRDQTHVSHVSCIGRCSSVFSGTGRGVGEKKKIKRCRKNFLKGGRVRQANDMLLWTKLER